MQVSGEDFISVYMSIGWEIVVGDPVVTDCSRDYDDVTGMNVAVDGTSGAQNHELRCSAQLDDLTDTDEDEVQHVCADDLLT